jgi:hypothetical protein
VRLLRDDDGAPAYRDCGVSRRRAQTYASPRDFTRGSPNQSIDRQVVRPPARPENFLGRSGKILAIRLDSRQFCGQRDGSAFALGGPVTREARS